MVFCGPKTTMMPSESSWDFFIKGIRLVRTSIAKSFSLAGEGHCNCGRFPVELPSGRNASYDCFEFIYLICKIHPPSPISHSNNPSHLESDACVGRRRRSMVIEVKKEAKNVMQRYDIRPMLMTNKETYLCLSDIDFVVFIIFF